MGQNRKGSSRAKHFRFGPDWLREIQHDGFRIMARREAKGVRLITRNGHEFSKRFPRLWRLSRTLPARACLIDGEAIVTDGPGSRSSS